MVLQGPRHGLCWGSAGSAATSPSPTCLPWPWSLDGAQALDAVAVEVVEWGGLGGSHRDAEVDGDALGFPVVQEVGLS